MIAAAEIDDDDLEVLDFFPDLVMASDEAPAAEGNELIPCDLCDGRGMIAGDTASKNPLPCPECQGQGYFGLRPEQPTQARPGSGLKVAIMSARYYAGLPLWHEDDCKGHGPNGEDE